MSDIPKQQLRTIDVDFPAGHILVKTKATGLQCGLYALKNSIQAQVKDIIRPSIKDLQDIAHSEPIASRLKVASQTVGEGTDITKNYLADHLAVILEEWGRKIGQVMHLGVLLSDGHSFVLYSSDVPGVRTVWIHNDLGQAAGALAHYSGIKPKAPKTVLAGANVSSETKQPEDDASVKPASDNVPPVNGDASVKPASDNWNGAPVNDDASVKLASENWGDSAANNDEQPAQDETESDPPAVSHEKVKMFFKSEFVMDRLCYPAMNGKVYGQPFQWYSQLNRIELVQSQKAFPGAINISCASARLMKVEHNPQMIKMHVGTICLNGISINDYEIHAPGTFDLPDYFDAPEDWKEKHSSGKCLLSFTVNTRNLAFLNPDVPAISSEFSQDSVGQFFTDLRTLKNGDPKFIKFEVIVAFLPTTEGDDYILTKMGTKIAEDKAKNPLHAWVKDSPFKHELRAGNVLPVDQRPKLSHPTLVLKRKKVHHERLAWLIPMIYSRFDERQYELGLRDEIGNEPFKVAFTAIPGSEVPNSDYDNKEPKLYLMYTEWPRKLDFPNEGDVFKVNMPFTVPDCPEPPPEEVRIIKKNHVEDPNDDGVVDDGGEILKQHVTGAQKNDREAEMRESHNKWQRTQWTAVVLAPSELNPDGQPLFLLIRPADSLWEGKKEDQPTVGTKIPVAERRILHLALHKKYIVSPQALKHEVKTRLVDSDQTFKDTINRLNDFVALDSSPSVTSTQYANHMVELMINGDRDLEFPLWYMWDDMYLPAKEYIFKNMFDPSQAADMLAQSFATHGTMCISGVPAAGKTFVALCYALAYLWKPIEGQQKRKALITTDTNAGVNSLAIDWSTHMNQIIEGVTVEKLRELKTIRVHGLDAEKKKFYALFIAPKFRQFFDEEGAKDASYLIEKIMGQIGIEYEDSRKKGDPRFDPRLEEMALYQVMFKKIHSKAGDENEDYFLLRTELHEKAENPDDPTTSWEHINKLYDLLQRDCLYEADCIITTCALATREALASRICPTLLVKDEDARSPGWVTPGILAAYHKTLERGIFSADNMQKGAWLNVARDTAYSAFENTAKFPTFDFFRDAGLTTIFLKTQFRMWNPKYVSWVSDKYYNGAMVDGNASKEMGPKARFIQKFIKETFGVDNNVVMVVLSGTRCTTEDGSNSSYNDLVHRYIMEMIQKLLDMLDAEKEIEFDKSEFRIRIESSYKAVVNAAKKHASEKHWRNVFANTLETIQGLGETLIIRANPNTKMTEFGGKRPDNLVANTRFKEGYIYVVTKESISPATYGYTDQNAILMVELNNVGTVYQASLFFQEHNSIVEVTVDDYRICGFCKEPGHIKEDCPRSEEQEKPACANCFSFEHTASKCPHPMVIPPLICTKCEKEGHTEKACPGKIVCHQCGKNGHWKGNCPDLPKKKCYQCGSTNHKKAQCTSSWCKKCKSAKHAYDDCPNAVCTRCGTKGHWAGSKACRVVNLKAGSGQTRATATLSNAIENDVEDQMVLEQTRQYYYESADLLYQADDSIFNHAIKSGVRKALHDMEDKSLEKDQESNLVDYTTFSLTKVPEQDSFDQSPLSTGSETSFFVDDKKLFGYFTSSAISVMDVMPKNSMTSGFVVSRNDKNFKAWQWKSADAGQLFTTWVESIPEDEGSWWKNWKLKLHKTPSRHMMVMLQMRILGDLRLLEENGEPRPKLQPHWILQLKQKHHQILSLKILNHLVLLVPGILM